MNKSKVYKLIFIIGLLLVVIAICLAVLNVYTASTAEKEAKATEQVIETKLETMDLGFFDDSEIGNGKDMPTMEVDGELYIGVIEVPRLEIKLPVMADWDENKLKKSPCRYSGNYFTDDMVVCGHNYRGNKHFGQLRSIADNDDVYFITVSGEIIHYRAIRGERLEPTQVDEMITKTDWDLTLYTCTSSGSERLTIRCERVK